MQQYEYLMTNILNLELTSIALKCQKVPINDRCFNNFKLS